MEKPSTPGVRIRRRALGMAALLIVGAASLIGSYSTETPRPYPGVALGWSLLYHVERAGLLIGILALFMLVSWRAIHGEIPIKFGQILEYAPRETLPLVNRMQSNLDSRIATLEDQLGVGDEPGMADDKRLQ